MAPIVELSHAQGVLHGFLAALSQAQRHQLAQAVLAEEVIRSGELAGERLDLQSVRSCLELQTGPEKIAPTSRLRHADGAVRIVLDATTNCQTPLTAERLLGWHTGLFPTGFSGLAKVRVGNWRDDAAGPMQMVLGPAVGSRLDLQPPPAERLGDEVGRFLDWLNRPPGDHPSLMAGLAYLWFLILRPFEAGNGRIARAMAKLLLARADGCARPYYSLSAQIQRERQVHDQLLERSARQGLDATEWLAWFLETVQRAVEQSLQSLDGMLVKSAFWQRWAATPLTQRQVQVLDRLLDGFEGKLTSTRWAVMADCSPDTALRDINHLVRRGILRKSDAGGRSTRYELNGLEIPAP